MSPKLLFVCIIIVCCLFNAQKASALILTGVDTISYPKEYGFDFINGKACTTAIFDASYGCNNHFWFFYLSSMEKFDLSSYGGYGYQAGKVNLDSLKTAPPDSIFNKLSLHIDSLPQDSLRYFIGNCYIIKTGTDPRYQRIYYAKIRILGFKIIDSTSHKVEMRFLWACDRNSSRNLTTTGLDTFHLDNTATLSRDPKKLSPFSPSGQRALKVVGERFTVPAGKIREGSMFSVFDLAGKRLGSAVVGKDGVVDLRTVRKGVRGVVVVGQE